MRWELSTQNRGAMDIMECEEHKLWALGWHDHFYKTFVCNAGSSDLGQPAKKKRQRDDGSNYFKFVTRPEALQRFYEACGAIDQHNRHRQHLLKLEKIWLTKRWQTRVLYSVMVGMVAADAHLMSAHLLPDRHSESKESMARFVAKLSAQMMPDEEPPGPPTASPATSLVSFSSASSDPGCTLEKIGKVVIVEGKGAGKFRPADARCAMCIFHKRRHGTTGRATKTIWRCAKHPDVPLCSAHKANCLGEHINMINGGE